MRSARDLHSRRKPSGKAGMNAYYIRDGKYFSIFSFLLLFGSTPVSADIGFSGYLKSLYSYSRSPVTRSPYWLDLNRARLTFDSSTGLGESMWESLAGPEKPDPDAPKEK